MVKLRDKEANNIANGLILLAFGFLLLLIQLRITNHWIWLTYIKTPSTFFLIAGGISLWIKREKSFGWVLVGIGLIGYSNILLEWSKVFTPYALPIVIMISGITLILFAKFN